MNAQKCAVCATVPLLLMSAAVFEPASAKDKGAGDAVSMPMVTISDIGRPYTVIDGVCASSMYPPITVTDGFDQTLNSASKSLAKIARQQGADAIVGMTVSWETPNSVGSKGRILLCGTMIKFK